MSRPRARRPGIAAAHLTRALQEPPAPADRPRILAALAEAEACAGVPGACERLRHAIELERDERERARLRGRLGRMLAAVGQHAQATVEFKRALKELLGEDGMAGEGTVAPDRVALVRMLQAEIAIAAFSGSAPFAFLTAAADQLLGGAGPPSALEPRVLALAAARGALEGRPREEYLPLIERALEVSAPEQEVSRDSGLMLTPLAVAMLYADDLVRSRRLLDAALERARADGSLLAMATVRYLRAWPRYFSGEVVHAAFDAECALAACDDGWSLHAGAACAVLAHCRLERAEPEGAAQALRRGEQLGLAPDGWQHQLLLVARGRLALAEGDPAAALEHLREAARRVRAQGVGDRVVAWRGIAALASLALGEREAAQALALEEQARAQATGSPRELGTALRVRGLVRGGVQGIELLRDAVRVLEGSPAALELARALLALGGALRRAGARAESRLPLRRALDLTQRTGAIALAREADAELRAAGGRPRRAALSGLEALTPSEWRVAELAAGGLSNREIAQRLFVTTKAVEFHLTRVYRKLDVRSRAPLAALFDGAPSSAELVPRPPAAVR